MEWKTTQQNLQAYSKVYFVVGSGSAGSVLAGRLAANNPEHAVVLFEAGGKADEYPEIWDPNMVNALPDISAIQWGYKTVPQQGLNHRILDVSRAKVTGGCTAHNDMVYARGARNDYNSWAKEFGCTGWDFDSVEPAFKIMETVIKPTITIENDFSSDYIGACESLGIPYNPNYNTSASMEGVSPHQSTINSHNVRVTSYRTYVDPYIEQGNANLFVITGALIDQVIFSGKRAVGVRFLQNGKAILAEGATEVILCAGAISSPLILMRSGIGPANELRRAGVENIRVDLPGVGKNLQNALIFKGSWKAKKPIQDQPRNLGYAIVFANITADNRPRTCCEMTRGLYTYPQSPDDLRYHYSITGGAMCLQSQGGLRLLSADPTAAPEIDMRFLTAAGDYDQLREAFHLMRDIGNSVLLSSWRDREISPGPDVRTPDQIKNWLLNNSYSYSHPVGTCKMGVDRDAVVTPSLCVQGAEGLRIADASIMPRITAGHTQGPALMIGERAAEILLGE